MFTKGEGDRMSYMKTWLYGGATAAAVATGSAMAEGPKGLTINQAAMVGAAPIKPDLPEMRWDDYDFNDTTGMNPAERKERLKQIRAAKDAKESLEDLTSGTTPVSEREKAAMEREKRVAKDKARRDAKKAARAKSHNEWVEERRIVKDFWGKPITQEPVSNNNEHRPTQDRPPHVAFGAMLPQDPQLPDNNSGEDIGTTTEEELMWNDLKSANDGIKAGNMISGNPDDKDDAVTKSIKRAGKLRKYGKVLSLIGKMVRGKKVSSKSAVRAMKIWNSSLVGLVEPDKMENARKLGKSLNMYSLLNNNSEEFAPHLQCYEAPSFASGSFAGTFSTHLMHSDGNDFLFATPSGPDIMRVVIESGVMAVSNAPSLSPQEPQRTVTIAPGVSFSCGTAPR
jgi:hypothetical protein